MVILINGPSSSGKSSVIAELNKKLPDLYFNFGIDKFLEPSMPPQLNMEHREHLIAVDNAISAFNKSLGIYANEIKSMIVDHVLQGPAWINDVADSLANTDVLFVGMTAPLEVIEARELLRPDRQPGTARAQYEQMLSYRYDLVIDSSILSAEEAADEIILNLKPGQALKTYRQRQS